MKKEGPVRLNFKEGDNTEPDYAVAIRKNLSCSASSAVGFHGNEQSHFGAGADL